MAIHWKIPFKSLNETAYVVNIYDADYSGEPVELTGGAQPFVTNEDDATDIFTPLRAQTGYINVIDEDGTLMEQMMPTSATSHYVEVKSGDTIRWQGFLTDEAYSQAWDNQPKEINVAVRSVLGIMNSIALPTEYASETKTIKALITSIMSEIEKYMPHSPYTDVVYPKDASLNEEELMLYLANFFEYVEQVNENEKSSTAVGASLADALTVCCEFLGWECREVGHRLFFSNIDTKITAVRVYADNGSTETTGNKATINLSHLTFVSTDHQQGFVGGQRTIKIDANINPMDNNEFTNVHLPEVSRVPMPSPRTSTLPALQWGGMYFVTSNPTAYWFAQMGQKDSHVSFRYWYYNVDRQGPTYTSIGSTQQFSAPSYPTFDNILVNNQGTGANIRRYATTFDGQTMDVWSDVDFPVGAYFLCADFYDASQLHPEYKNMDGVMALMYAAIAEGPAGQPVDADHYVIKMESNEFTTGDGYFVIDFSAIYFTLVGAWGTSGFIADGFMTFAVKMGDKWWNESQQRWMSGFSAFQVPINKDDGRIKTNKTVLMPTSGSSGWYIPTDIGDKGKLTLYVLPKINLAIKCATNTGSSINASVWQVFFKSLSVDFISVNDITKSQDSANTYLRVLSIGASAEKKVSLKLATDNNNIEGFGIVRNADLTKPTTWPYYTGTGTATKDQRPELHLLDRMATYYGKVRRWFKVKVRHPETILPLIRYYYNGITYAPVAESRNWRDDESEITLTEIPT